MNKKNPKIAVIGAGASGLSAAYYLTKSGYSVDVFESSSEIGGLGASYGVEGYHAEKFVHHLFDSDIYFKNLIDELGLSDQLEYQKSKDAIYISNKIFPFSSAFDLLTFSPISIISRVRTGFMAVYLKKTKGYQKFEKHTAQNIITKIAGKESFQKVWEPLLISKFGKHSPKISMAWFWARIYSRTPKLGYLNGGYKLLFEVMVKKIKEKKGQIFLSTPIVKIQTDKRGNFTLYSPKKHYQYDYVIVTIPPSVFEKITPKIQKTNYAKKLRLKEMISATSLNLVLKKSFMSYYWLNIVEKDFPFLVLVEHTNLIPKEKYGGRIMLYIGNYLNHTDQKFINTKEKNLELFLPYLKKINPKFSSSWIKSYSQFNALYAQPIVDTKYSDSIPSMKTPVKNLFLTTMSQIYPFDRGTNYAIRDGKKIAQLISNSLPDRSSPKNS